LIKIIRLYNADKGSWPAASCLGSDYPTGFDGSGTGQCLSANVVSNTFLSQIQPYTGSGSLPAPDMQTIGDSSNWRRGIWYSESTNPYDIWVTQDKISNCPKLGGADYHDAVGVGSGRFCRYKIQPAS
jgi:hypothetical protein